MLSRNVPGELESWGSPITSEPTGLQDLEFNSSPQKWTRGGSYSADSQQGLDLDAQKDLPLLRQGRPWEASYRNSSINQPQLNIGRNFDLWVPEIAWGPRCGHHQWMFWMKLKSQERDFPGGPVAKTPRCQFRGPRVQALVRELDPTCHS